MTGGSPSAMNAGAVREFLAGFDDGDVGGKAGVVQGRPAEQNRLVFAIWRQRWPEVVIFASRIGVIEPHEEATDDKNHPTTT